MRLSPVLRCAFTAVLPGCGLLLPTPPAPPFTKPDITGAISQVDLQRSPPHILIQSSNTLDLTMDGSTSILVQGGNREWQKGTTRDLKTGSEVEAWVKGSVVGTSPGQALADVVAFPADLSTRQ